MSIVKDFRFPVSVRLIEGRRTIASAVDKDDWEIATPRVSRRCSRRVEP